MEQAEVLWEGDFIGNRQETEFNILVYEVEELILEVCYHRETNAIRKFEALTREEDYQRYLSQN